MELGFRIIAKWKPLESEYSRKEEALTIMRKSAQGKSRVVVPILFVIVVVLFAMFRNGVDNGGPEEEAAHTAPPPASKSASAHAVPASPASPTVSASDQLKSAYVDGDAVHASMTISVGWHYDQATQINPQLLASALQAVDSIARTSGGRAAVVVVDTDVPVADRVGIGAKITQPGISIAGQGRTIMINGNPGEGSLDPDHISAIVTGAMER